MAKRQLTLIEILAVCSLILLLTPLFFSSFFHVKEKINFSQTCERCRLFVRTAILFSLCDTSPVQLLIHRINGSYVLRLIPQLDAVSSLPFFSKAYPLKGVSQVLVKDGRKKKVVERVDIVFPSSFHASKKIESIYLQQGDNWVEISLEP